MSRRLTTCILLCLIISLKGCSEAEEFTPSETESENLNKMLKAAPASLVNLDEKKPDTLIIPSDRIFEEKLLANDTLKLNSRPIQLRYFKDHLVTIEDGSGNVTVLNLEGTPVRRVTGNSDDAVQFERPISVTSSGQNLHVFDDGLKKMNVFDQEFHPTDSYELPDVSYAQNHFVMNSSFMAYQNENASGLFATDPEAPLLIVRPVDSPDSVHARLMPRVVPSGKQPGPHNNLTASMNSRNMLVSAYIGLPYLFVFDDFEHVHTVVLESSHFDSLENPPLTPADPEAGVASRVNRYYDYLHVHENGDILLMSNQILYHIKRTTDDDYEIHRSYYLLRGDNGKPVETILAMDHPPDDPSRIYAVGTGYLFEMNLE